MTNTSLVSIIVPCYQAEKTLPGTLEDIYQQTYKPIEIIAVNDGSNDGTQQILDHHQGRVTAIQQTNRGAAAARNAGFKQSKGSYVLFCDADVRLQPHMIEAMVQTLEKNPTASYCYSNFKFGWHTFDLFPFDGARLRQENYISTMSLIRRDAFIGFDESLNRLQDWDLWKRMLDQGHQGVWHNERLFSAPMRRGGISSYSIASIFQLIKRKILGR